MYQPPSSPKETGDPHLLRKSRAYKHAFEAYMRTGEPIAMQEVKARAESETPSTTRYIWRTQGDGKVRASHRANDGKIFARDDPPPTGHPGEDYGCRCWAEAYEPDVQEFARQTLVSAVNDAKPQWDTVRFLFHFRFGGGAAVTLRETGNLQGIIDYYSKTLGAHEDVNGQIADAAREAEPGRFEYRFDSSYDFGPYIFGFGHGVVAGIFRGTSIQSDNALKISGSVSYVYSDTFTDPRSIRKEEIGTSDPMFITEENIGTEYWGTYFTILDEWETSYEAVVHEDRSKSRYVK